MESPPPVPAASVLRDIAPSEWVVRFGRRVAAGGSVLDVACGSGRHVHWFADRGHAVDAVDRERPAKLSPQIAFQQADIEAGPWPYAGMQFAAVIVTNYLHRPLMNHLLDAVAPGGWLIYETFAMGNERFGRPSRPEFLLRPGELLNVVANRLQVCAYEHGYVDLPKPAVIQRIAAQFVAG